MIKKHIIALMAFLAIGAFSAISQSMINAQTAKPDFAFPDKVARDADSRLEKALRSGNGEEVVHSLVCYSLAKNAISPTLLPPVLSRIDSVKQVEKDPCVKSLLSFLQAKIYNDIYNSDRWNYDRRDIPTGVTTTDYTQWDGRQFKNKIGSLLKEATAPEDILASSSVQDWKNIITGDEYTYLCYPTLFDFIAYNSIDIYQNIAGHNAVLPMKLFQPQLLLEPLPAMALVDSYSRDAHALCTALVNLHRGHPASEIMARIKAIQSLSQLVYFQENSDYTELTAFRALYNEFAGNDWSCEILLSFPVDNNDRDYIRLLKKAIDTYPHYVRINALKQRVAYAEMKEVEFKVPRYTTPGKAFTLTATLKNIDKATINVYRSPRPMTEEIKTLNITNDVMANLEGSYSLSVAPREKPFSTNKEFTLKLSQPGRYFIWASFDGQQSVSRISEYQTIVCSDIAPLAVGLDGKIYPYAVASDTGAPLAGITVSSKNYNDKVFKNLGITNISGTLAEGTENKRIMRFQKGGDAITFDSPWVSTRRTSEPAVEAAIFTSLPVYHHGDSITWSIVSFISDNGKNKVNANCRLRVILADVNNQEIAAYTIITDATGRATGVFQLPEEGLSGNYRFRIDNNGRNVGYGTVMVNDYKLPTFEAEVTDVKRTILPDSLIQVTCKAESYSGFPIAAARVKVTLEAVNQIFWRNAYKGITFWSDEMTTNSDGTVTLNITDKILALNPVFKSRLNVIFDITSADGETRSCTRIITTGKPYTIYPPAGSMINLDSKPAISVEVCDANNQKISIPLKYQFMKDSTEVANFTTGQDFPVNIPVGYYEVVISPVDPSLADSVTARGFLLYRNTGPSPTEDILFLPVQEFTTREESVSVLLGCSKKDANVLVVTSVDGKLKSREWFRPSDGMQEYKVTIPALCNQVEVLFSTIYDNNQKDARVIIHNKRTKKDLAIEVELFRDKVIPGTPEKIIVRVKENGIGVPASVIMRMESKSILAIQPNPLRLSVPAVRYGNISTTGRNNVLYNSVSAPVKDLTWPSIPIPELQTYGLDYTSYMQRKLRNLKSMSVRGTVTGAGDVDEVIVDEAVEYESAAPMFATATAKVENGAMVGVTEDAAEEEPADAGEGAAPAAPDNYNYRPSEIPLAFFAPMLQTEPDGSLTYTYTVPDANTTWVMKALAYTPDMLTSTIERSTVASRPVMVQANAPRFMRYGDSTTLRATVMNNTDSVMSGETVISILSPENLEPITTRTVMTSMEGGSSEVVSIPFRVPSSGQAVILRVKSTAGEYTDGEQALIPLLPASQPVITSRSFFVPSSQEDANFTFRGFGNSGTTTFYMYDNPLWEIITALPSLNDGDAVTSCGAMNVIYMASVACGIMDKNPELKKALSDWLRSDRAGSTLASALERNDQLKQLSLNATPWVRDAMSDSERLTSLALMLDDKNLDRIVSKAVKTLGNCQVQGGLSWCQEGKYPSMWCTYRVLTLAASLTERGYMPGDSKLRNIISDAVSYIDSQVAERLRKEKNPGDFTQYTYIRSLLKDIKPSTRSARAIQLTINDILKRWKNGSTTAKGIDAVILYRNDYPTMARQIVSSIKSFAMTEPEKGTWWDAIGVDLTAGLLYTIETVTPGDEELIQSVAQWLIMNKTNQAWNSASATSATIDALLGAIDITKAINGSASASVNGRAVSDKLSGMPGMTVAEIPVNSTDDEISVEVHKATGLPVMGSVINRAILPMDKIAQVVHPSVSIEKRYNVIRDGIAEIADTLKVGDRVKIQLVLTVKDDLDYVTIVDRRSACMEPVNQLSGYTGGDGMWYYREMTDSETRYFIEKLPRGTYVIDTEMNIVAEGTFSSGVATVQSQLNPGVAANSSSVPVNVIYK